MRLTLIAVYALAMTGLAWGQPTTTQKGDLYRPPAGSLKDEVLWAAKCEEPAGQGLAFSGQSQVADDGQPHTRILVDGKWVPIGDELRKANPLQKHHEELWKLRTELKDLATQARFIYFEGRSETDEKAFLASKVNPASVCNDRLGGEDQ